MSTPDGTPVAPDFSGRPVPDLSGLVSARAFHGLVKADADGGFKGEGSSGYVVAKDLDDVEIARESKGFRFTSTSDTKDADGDIIESAGGDWERYKKNPIILRDHQAHGRGEWPAQIGTATEIKHLKSRTDLLVEFTPPEVNPAGERVRLLIEWRMDQKALSDRAGAMSIGFRPTDFAWDKKLDGVRFAGWEVLENSFVSVPSNPDALRRMIAAGIDLDWVIEDATKTLEAAGFVITKQEQADALAVVETLDPATAGGSLVEVAEIKPTKLADVLARLPDAERALIESRLPEASDDLRKDVDDLGAKLDQVLAKLAETKAAPGPPPAPVVTAAAFEETMALMAEEAIARKGHAVQLPRTYS